MTDDQIASGVRTVTHLAVYIEELKDSASGLAESIDAVQRGYFTPEEDQAARAVLVSYWQSRNALLELIASFREGAGSEDDDYPAAFLVAFTAALILVDAARFLRELASGRPVVRRKLNEPAPNFGIPGGTYDTVQKSLVSARHAWHLYHAVRYFEENEPMLRQMAGDGPLCAVLEINDRLRHRLDVSLTQFAGAKFRTRTDQLMRRFGREVIVRAMYGLQKLGAGMMADVYVRRGHRPSIPDPIAGRLHELLAPGDVLVVRKEHALTNYFLPGYWPHAALYLGSARHLQLLGLDRHREVVPRWARCLAAHAGQPPRVLESMKDGVLIRPVASPFASDSIVVLRSDLSEPQLAEALGRAIAHEGKPYDFDFNFARSDRLVCTEVVYRAYQGIGPIDIELTHRAGRPTLSGSDLVRMGIRRTHFRPVAVFAPAYHQQLLTGLDADEVLNDAEWGDGK